MIIVCIHRSRQSTDLELTLEEIVVEIEGSPFSVEVVLRLGESARNARMSGGADRYFAAKLHRLANLVKDGGGRC